MINICPTKVSSANIRYPLSSNVTGIIWSGNDISEIDSSIFKQIGSIKELKLVLSYNRISELRNRTFESAGNLTWLYLDNNEIEELHNQMFYGLTNLSSLYLDQNHIAKLEPTVFDTLLSLVKLGLNGNKITDFHPEQFKGLSNLEYLGLNGNNISKFHRQQFHGLNSLFTLDISKNRITTLHEQQFLGLVSLKRIWLSFNPSTELPSFEGLYNLEIIYAESVNVKQLHPQQFANLSKLWWLNLLGSDITELHPKQFEGVGSNASQPTWFYLSENAIVDVCSQQFKSANVGQFGLSMNNIYKLTPNCFEGFKDTWGVMLRDNHLEELYPQQFAGLQNLSRLDLANNRIQKLHPTQFEGLDKLFHVFLEHNLFTELHPHQFKGFVRLNALILFNNRITNLKAEVFRNSSSLEYLSLKNNEIDMLHPQSFDTLRNLTTLDLRRNRITALHQPLFLVLYKLKYLLLGDNRLSKLPFGVFQNLYTLKILDLSRNRINWFNSYLYFNNTYHFLDAIDLRKNSLYSVNSASFGIFRNTTRVIVDKSSTCCFVKSGNCSATYPRSQFLTCGRLLPNQIQRIIMWVLTIFAVCSNILVLFYRSRYNQRVNKVQALFIFHLSLSDLVMGIYMLNIVIADAYYSKNFPSEAWRTSITCKVAGTLSVVSSEASVFFVTLISIDRFMGIKFTFSGYRFRTSSSKIIILVLWGLAMILGIMSTLISSINPELYDVAEVCTGLPLSRSNIYQSGVEEYVLGRYGAFSTVVFDNTYETVIGDKPGMYFGIAVFTVLNLICFVVVSVCYIGIFVTVIQTANQAGRTLSERTERKMAAKMGAIVLTDLACWLPIIILSILVQSGRYIVTPNVYTWIITFVLPVNSAMNPFLYTLAAVIFDFTQKRRNRSTTMTSRRSTMVSISTISK